jgi:hypothetical protein
MAAPFHTEKAMPTKSNAKTKETNASIPASKVASALSPRVARHPRADNLADDLLDGAVAMGEFIGWPAWKVYYAASKGQLPVRKIGPKRITATKSALRAYFGGGGDSP